LNLRKFVFIILLITPITLFSFWHFFHTENIEYRKVVVPDKFSLSIPSYLSASNQADSSALLQLFGSKENIFMLVYEIPIDSSNTLKFTFNNSAQEYISKMNSGSLLKYYPKKINNLNSYIGNIRGLVGKTNIYYRVAVIESRSTYYKIVLGITNEEQSSYDADFNIILESFTSIK